MKLDLGFKVTAIIAAFFLLINSCNIAERLSQLESKVDDLGSKIGGKQSQLESKVDDLGGSGYPSKSDETDSPTSNGSIYSSQSDETDSPTSNGSISSQPDDDPIVHITRTGHKYHSAGCRYLSKSDIPVTLSE